MSKTALIERYDEFRRMWVIDHTKTLKTNGKKDFQALDSLVFDLNFSDLVGEFLVYECLTNKTK